MQTQQSTAARACHATPDPSAEQIAFALWPDRRKYRNLHAGEFKDEMSLLIAVRTDLSMRNFHDLIGAKDFYKDLNQNF